MSRWRDPLITLRRDGFVIDINHPITVNAAFVAAYWLCLWGMGLPPLKAFAAGFFLNFVTELLYRRFFAPR